MAANQMYRLSRFATSVFRHASLVHRWAPYRRYLTLSECKLRRPTRLTDYFILSFLPFEIFKKSEPEESKTNEEPLTEEEKRNKQMQPLLEKTDKLYNQLDYRKVYSLLLVYKDDDNDEVLWRLGRATFELAKMAKSTDEKITMNKEALSYVEKALDINDDNFACHKWMAILIDTLSEFEGTKARIKRSEDVKYHIKKATELNPKDATSLYMLGMWCYSFAELSWYERKVASIIFSTPPTSTFEEALEAFLRAEQTEPKFYSMNLLMLGKTYMKLGLMENAIRYLISAKNFPLKTEDDKQAHREANELLNKLGVK